MKRLKSLKSTTLSLRSSAFWCAILCYLCRHLNMFHFNMTIVKLFLIYFIEGSYWFKSLPSNLFDKSARFFRLWCLFSTIWTTLQIDKVRISLEIYFLYCMPNHLLWWSAILSFCLTPWLVTAITILTVYCTGIYN